MTRENANSALKQIFHYCMQGTIHARQHTSINHETAVWGYSNEAHLFIDFNFFKIILKKILYPNFAVTKNLKHTDLFI